jgi:hypothetical protein
MNDLTPEPTPEGGDKAPLKADMTQAVTRVERSIKERRDTDTTLINWWLYFFIVGPFTLHIYTWVLYFKRVSRADRFSARKHAYYDAVIDWTERYAQQAGREDEVHHLLVDMRSEVQVAFKGSQRRMNAGLMVLFTIFTLGLYGIYAVYRLNKYWWDAMVIEQEFDDKLSQAWSTLGLMRYPISFAVDQSKRRSYGLYLLLSFITLSIWYWVWDYKIHTDPDNLYSEFHSIEDTVLQTVRAQ